MKDFDAIIPDDDLHVQFTINEISCIFIIHTWYAYRSRYYFLPTPEKTRYKPIYPYQRMPH
jgi:hypothetical protein